MREDERVRREQYENLTPGQAREPGAPADGTGPDETVLSPAERELAAALGSLAPAGHTVDRDETMYRAGFEAGRQSVQAWRTTAGLLTAALVVSVGLSLTMRGMDDRGARVATRDSGERPGVGVRVPDVADGPGIQASATQAPSRADAERVQQTLTRLHDRPLGPASGRSYLVLRDEVLREGVAALPAQTNERSPQEHTRVMRLLDARPGSPAARELGL